MTFEIDSSSPATTSGVGSSIASCLKGGEVIELVGDLGAGKTQLVRGLAAGIESRDSVQSPTFTISRQYIGPQLTIYHYDFYRLGEQIGIIQNQLEESLSDEDGVVVTEWAHPSHNLPTDRLTIKFQVNSEVSRRLEITAHGAKSRQLLTAFKAKL